MEPTSYGQGHVGYSIALFLVYECRLLTVHAVTTPLPTKVNDEDLGFTTVNVTARPKEELSDCDFHLVSNDHRCTADPELIDNLPTSFDFRWANHNLQWVLFWSRRPSLMT